MTITVSKDGYATRTVLITEGPYSTGREQNESCYYRLQSDSWNVNLYKLVELIPSSSAQKPFVQPGSATSDGHTVESRGSPGAGTDPAAPLLSRERVLDGAEHALVKIQVGDAYGTGFFIAESGIIVTSRGVVGSTTSVRVNTTLGPTDSASIYVSPSRDLAFI